MNLPAAFELYRDELEAELRSIIEVDSLPLYDMMSYHLGWIDEGGHPQTQRRAKLLRPTICLLACKAAGGELRQALPAAAAVELLHNFSLIHDDIEDGSPYRRHQLTVWRIWGQSQAINVGDAMHALSQLALLRLKERGVAPEKIIRSTETLDKACVQLCEGQYLDIAYEGRLNIGVQDYINMILRKTAALFAASARLGALLGTEDETMIDHLSSFGQELGLAYQIRDDVLGIWGKEEEMGKPSYSDIQKRKKTLPIIYGMERGSEQEEKDLRSFFQQETIEHEDIGRIVEILDKIGAQSYAQEMAEVHHRRSLSALEAAGLDPFVRKELADLATFLLERSY